MPAAETPTKKRFVRAAALDHVLPSIDVAWEYSAVRILTRRSRALARSAFRCI